ncbi:MAG: hypothetical protein KDA87_10385 [Planctomycetales bacterium]|nr:hypothetical protein [Planctomycetales bacterium]
MLPNHRTIAIWMLLTISTARSLNAQPWNMSRNELGQVLSEGSPVSSVLDGIRVDDLGLEAVTCREHSLRGATYQVGFKNRQVEFVQFRPRYSRTEPNWYGQLCVLFGDNPLRRNWDFDAELTGLFPWITQSELNLLPRLKLGRSRLVTVDSRSGAIVAAGAWQPDLVPTGRFYWNHSASHVFRYVFRRRDGQAYLVIEGTKFKSKKIVPNAINVQRPFVHRPQDIRNVFVATPNTFYSYLLRSCGKEIETSLERSNYENQVAKSIPNSVRESARRVRLAAATQFALHSNDVNTNTIIQAVNSLDRQILLNCVVTKRGNSRHVRDRKLEILSKIGERPQLEYCVKFIDQSAYRRTAIEAMRSIAERAEIALPEEDNANSNETWKHWAEQVIRS